MIFFSHEIKNKIVDATHIDEIVDTTGAPYMCQHLRFPCQNPALNNITFFIGNIIMSI